MTGVLKVLKELVLMLKDYLQDLHVLDVVYLTSIDLKFFTATSTTHVPTHSLSRSPEGKSPTKPAIVQGSNPLSALRQIVEKIAATIKAYQYQVHARYIALKSGGRSPFSKRHTFDIAQCIFVNPPFQNLIALYAI